MIATSLFVISFSILVFYFIKVISVCLGSSMSVPAPILYHFDISFGHTNLYTPAMIYQVYFWTTKLNIIG